MLVSTFIASSIVCTATSSLLLNLPESPCGWRDGSRWEKPAAPSRPACGSQGWRSRYCRPEALAWAASAAAAGWCVCLTSAETPAWEEKKRRKRVKCLIGKNALDGAWAPRWADAVKAPTGTEIQRRETLGVIMSLVWEVWTRRLLWKWLNRTHPVNLIRSRFGVGSIFRVSGKKKKEKTGRVEGNVEIHFN